MSNETGPATKNQNEEPWSLVSVAFGAVTGAIISVLIQPLVELLPGRLFEEFLARLVEDALLIGVPILLAFAVARIHRLDHLLQRFLLPASLGVSLLFGLSLWIRAGTPTNRWPVVAVVLSLTETGLFLLFCGGAVGVGLSQIAGKQEEQYTREREAEAQQIAGQAIAEGDPDLAAGIFSSNVAGEFSQGIAVGCLKVLLFSFHMAAIWVVSALDAHFLFNLSLPWSLGAATIIATAATRVVTLSEEFGERYSESVPLDEKYHGILPR
jgi:hypothetical protein